MFGLGKTKILERRYYPMIVSEKGTEERMSPEEDATVWNAFEKLSQEQKDVLLSGEMPQKVKVLQEKLRLSDLTTGSISLVIRKVFFGDISLDGMDEKLRIVLTSGGDDTQKVKDISKFIQNEILTIKPKPKVEEVLKEEAPRHVATIAKLPLLQALSKYEQLGNQLITEERIKLKSQSETVRPSLLYWIKYYRDELGVGHHSSVDRGNFLFRSENGKKLMPEERERVNLVLKSVEEDFPVEIDTEQNVIIFPSFVPQPITARPQQMFSPTQPPMAPQRVPFQPNMSAATFEPAPPVPQPGAMSFSSKHVLPAEKAAQRTEQPRGEMIRRPVAQARPASPMTAAQKGNPFHIRPVSLGREE